MTRVAVIGLGPMGIRHIKALKNIHSADLVAVVDTNPNAIDNAFKECSLTATRKYLSQHELINKESVELAIIATNGPSHFAIFKDLVNAGVKRILCEKPIATSLAEAKEMIELSRSRNVLLLVNHPRRWSNDYIELKSKLNQGIIGPIKSIYYCMGGGQLGCNGTHFIDLASFLLDDVVNSIIGFLDDQESENPRGRQFVDPGGHALVRFKSGVRMSFDMTEGLGTPPFFVINGKFGRVVIEETKGYYVIESRNDEDRRLPVTRYGTPLKNVEKIEFIDLNIVTLTERAIHFLLDGVIPVIPEEAYRALQAIISIHYSHSKENQIVTLPLVDQYIQERKFSFT